MSGLIQICLNKISDDPGIVDIQNRYVHRQTLHIGSDSNNPGIMRIINNLLTGSAIKSDLSKWIITENIHQNQIKRSFNKKQQQCSQVRIGTAGFGKFQHLRRLPSRAEQQSY
jgi:hypothetical protein